MENVGVALEVPLSVHCIAEDMPFMLKLRHAILDLYYILQVR